MYVFVYMLLLLFFKHINNNESQIAKKLNNSLHIGKEKIAMLTK